MGQFNRASRNQQGLSMIELMVAMALGLILTLGVSQIYLASSQTYRLNDAVSRLHENSGFAFDFMERAAREAGSRGCSDESRVGNWIDFSSVDDLLPGLFGGQSVQGWDYNGTGLDSNHTLAEPATANGGWTNSGGDNQLPSALQGEVVAGSDVFVVNRTRTETVEVENVGGGGNTGPSNVCPQGESIQSGNRINIDGGNASIPQGSVVFFDNRCRGGDIYIKTNDAGDTFTKGGGDNMSGGGQGAGFCTEYEAGDSVTLNDIQQVAFYVGINGEEQPALFMEQLGPASNGRQELIEGVESMQVLYGENRGSDANDRRQVERYIDASAVTDWDRIISVRIGLLMRSEDRVVDEASSRTFNVAGARLTTPTDERARISGSTTIGFRSRLE